MAQVPGDGANHGLNIEKVEWPAVSTPPKKTYAKALFASWLRPLCFTKPDIFVEGPEFAIFSPPEVTLENGGNVPLILTASEEETLKFRGQLLN